MSDQEITLLKLITSSKILNILYEYAGKNVLDVVMNNQFMKEKNNINIVNKLTF